jgi:hypothetical protein
MAHWGLIRVKAAKALAIQAAGPWQLSCNLGSQGLGKLIVTAVTRYSRYKCAMTSGSERDSEGTPGS